MGVPNLHVFIIMGKDTIRLWKNLEQQPWGGGPVTMDESNNKLNSQSFCFWFFFHLSQAELTVAFPFIPYSFLYSESRPF